MTGFNIFKKIWLYKAKKKIIEKYSHVQCDRTLDLFMRSYREYEIAIFAIHTNLVQLLKAIDDGINSSRSEYLMQQLNDNLNYVKRKFVNLFKKYRHCVRMYHWMYTHGHHNKYANIFDDGKDFKLCYESKIEKYEFEFKPFDIEYEIKKYKINKRKQELEKDFQ